MRKLIFIFLLFCANCFAQNYIGKQPTAQGDINTSGFSITNAGSISATNTLTVPNIVTTNLSVGATTITNPYKLLFSQTNSVGFSNTVSETSLLATNGFGACLLPANSVNQGSTYRVIATGYWGTANTNQTLQIKFNIGGDLMAQTIANSCPTNMGNTNYWKMESFIQSRDNDGTILVTGNFQNSQATTTGFFWNMINTSEQSIDPTIDNALDITATWSRANTNNTITTTSAFIEKLN